MTKRSASSKRSKSDLAAHERGTVGEALESARPRLEAAGVLKARAEAELMLAHLLHTDRGGLLVRRRDRLDLACATLYEQWVGRRARREPLQHLTQSQEFHGLEIKVDSRALIPRPETEGLVDAVLALDLPSGARVADFGTGSGCIAVALAVRRPDLVLYALDRSVPALELARENARLLGVERRIEFLSGDFGTPEQSLPPGLHAVVSNPPYVSEIEWTGLEPEVRDYDPREALVAGPTGYEMYPKLAPPAFALLQPGGHLVLELGFGQAETVCRIVAGTGFEMLDVRADLAGIERVLVARKP